MSDFILVKKVSFSFLDGVKKRGREFDIRKVPKIITIVRPIGSGHRTNIFLHHYFYQSENIIRTLLLN